MPDSVQLQLLGQQQQLMPQMMPVTVAVAPQMLPQQLLQQQLMQQSQVSPFSKCLYLSRISAPSYGSVPLSAVSNCSAGALALDAKY